MSAAASTVTSSAAAIYYYGLFDVENPDGRLRTTMTANVSIVLQQAKHVLTIPSAALSEAAPDHPIWTILGDYIGQFCATLTLVASPQRIVLGGGVMGNAALFPVVRAACAAALADYVPIPRLSATATDYIVPPGLGDRAGAIGALLLAESALA